MHGLTFLESEDKRSVAQMNDQSGDSLTRSTVVNKILSDQTVFRTKHFNIVEGEEVPRKVIKHIENSIPRRAKNYKRYQGGLGSTRCQGYGPSAAVQIVEKFYQTMDFDKAHSLNATYREQFEAPIET
jgi:hypothetical protein